MRERVLVKATEKGTKKDIGQLSGLVGSGEEEEEEQTESTHCDQSVER